MWYSIAADAIVAGHMAFVGFVVAGLALIWLGWLRRWNWVRGFWFRAAHLAAIGVVGLEAVFGVTCPLTHWERSLREGAGQNVSEASFVGRMIHDVLFVDLPEWALRGLHVAFALLVVATFVFVPPRRPGVSGAGS